MGINSSDALFSHNVHTRLFDCGLMSHSAIFQLYSVGTVVQFQNLDLLPGTQSHGQLGVFTVPNLPRHRQRDAEDVFNFLAIRGPTRGEGMQGIEPGSSDQQSSPQTLRHRSIGRSIQGTNLDVLHVDPTPFQRVNVTDLWKTYILVLQCYHCMLHKICWGYHLCKVHLS